MKHKILQRDLIKYHDNPDLLNAITLTTGKLETESWNVAEKIQRIIIWDGRGNWMDKRLPKIAKDSKIKFLDSGFTLTLKFKARNGETIKIKNTINLKSIIIVFIKSNYWFATKFIVNYRRLPCCVWLSSIKIVSAKVLPFRNFSC